MYVIAGLGNPGLKYEATRHNVGFLAIDEIYKSYSCESWKTQKGALVSKTTIAGEKVILVKPQTFMNNSGEPISAILGFYKVSEENLIVIYDDIDLDCGRIRIRKSGGPGTHNGMRSIVSCIGEGFMRIRLGVGKPVFHDLADYVLAKPNAQDREMLDISTKKTADVIRAIVSEGIERAMGAFNS